MSTLKPHYTTKSHKRLEADRFKHSYEGLRSKHGENHVKKGGRTRGSWGDESTDIAMAIEEYQAEKAASNQTRSRSKSPAEQRPNAENLQEQQLQKQEQQKQGSAHTSGPQTRSMTAQRSQAENATKKAAAGRQRN